MGAGFLKVQLRAANGSVPVSGTRVLIKDTNGNTIYDLVTDGSGETDLVKLPAPDRGAYNPNDTTSHYSLWDVYADHPNFEYMGKHIHGVHIFDQETTILPILMMPKSDGDPMYEDVYIPAKFGIELLKDQTPPDTQIMAQVLEDVIIPDYITVQLGTPNSAVNTVRVPFIDYVKNVCSHEVFPDWPTNTLEANMLAQISFALNRIFTVWYRSQGKIFDITNSTTVDQFFVYGGEIFGTVNAIGDRLFNSFIRRRGRLEPFFAEYCNGTTSTCPGMSQWGSYYLGIEGKTPVEILKSYYPQDIQIEASNNFATPVGSYPGTPLREGSTGPNVERMQVYLNRIRSNFPAIPAIPEVNGVFQSDTLNAVKKFQEINDIFPDGIIDRATWYKITFRYTGVKKLAELKSEGIRIGIGLTPPTNILQIGSRGEDVVELQFILNFIAEYYPTIPAQIEDGIFGEDTKRAVVSFQNKFGLNPDGIAGRNTWNKLYEMYHEIDEITPAEPGISGPYVPPAGIYPPFSGTSLRIGSRNSDVLIMQKYLNVISAIYPSIPRLQADEIFGSKTESAVKAFQKQFGLTADGIIGRVTWNAIVSEYNKLSLPSSLPAYPGTSLKMGSSGYNVSLMQGYLNVIAEVQPKITKQTVDGVFGSEMRSAVMEFQKLYGLNADGVIGKLTWDRIAQEYSKLSSRRSMSVTAAGSMRNNQSKELYAAIVMLNMMRKTWNWWR